MLKNATIYLFLISVLLFSCAPKEDTNEFKDVKGTYYSIKGYIYDQWSIHHDQPYGLVKIVKLDGKVDSSYISAIDMDWGSVLKLFIETDISDPKFLGKYDFTGFHDMSTASKNYFYEAKDKKLFTRRLEIVTDSYNNRIKSIFIETQKKTSISTKTQKLLYIPLKTISIQEVENSKIGAQTEVYLEYKFL